MPPIPPSNQIPRPPSVQLDNKPPSGNPFAPSEAPRPHQNNFHYNPSNQNNPNNNNNNNGYNYQPPVSNLQKPSSEPNYKKPPVFEAPPFPTPQLQKAPSNPAPAPVQVMPPRFSTPQRDNQPPPVNINNNNNKPPSSNNNNNVVANNNIYNYKGDSPNLYGAGIAAVAPPIKKQPSLY